MLKGIDVSNANGCVDWDKLKGNIDFAILRCGIGSDMSSQDDKQWGQNVAECNRLGIPWGAYLYSYAMSIAEAESEASHALRLLNGLKPVYPVYIDMEDADGYKAKRGGISKQMASDICRIFCERVTAAGYVAGVYANKDWAMNRIDMAQLAGYTFWLAQYSSKVTYTGKYDMWQYSSSGSLPGISGRVDMNYCYKDFAAVATPAIAGLTLDTSSKDMAASETYTLLARCEKEPEVDVTGRDVIRVLRKYKDPKGRGWLIDVQGLPPEPVVRHGHITVSAAGQTVQCNFNVL
ncbi:glycoside hydrolase family 25 protein [Faecalispora anaeroviscerum]|uniref:glycoside hydrolase family 25 protein n=1 Tax=Faecalispora anaeroviscerum TaxID=2991836 RepID=UPI0024B96508|nr:glycoside hydrolase family 25 protein [Faecalispora anaeroviscerum]